MRTGWNLGLQLAAVVVLVCLRLTDLGVFALAYLLVGGPVITLVPLVLAVAVWNRRWLERRFTIGFVGMAAAMVVVGALMPETDDMFDSSPRYTIPLLSLFGAGEFRLEGGYLALHVVSVLSLAAFLVLLVWTSVLVIRTRGTGPTSLEGEDPAGRPVDGERGHHSEQQGDQRA